MGNWFLDAERDDMIIEFLLDHLFKVSAGVVASCVCLLHPLYGLAVGIFLAVINFQVLGLMQFFGMKMDLIGFGVIVMAIGFEIEYVIHIAHAFLHCKGFGLERTRNSLEAMGLTVFSAFLSTATQQLVLLIFSTSLMFKVYPIIMLIVLCKSGITGFVSCLRP